MKITKTDSLLNDYKKYLQKKNHREEYIQEHLNFLRFFGTNFLNSYARVSLTEINPVLIEDFLGSWCIRKMYDFRKSDVIPNLRIFKKFSRFLFQKGIISEDRHQELIEVCNNPRKYVEEIERFIDLDPDAENWNEIFEDWMVGNDIKTKETLKNEIESILNVDKNLIENIPEDGTTNWSTIVRDFKTFGDYISENKKGIKLTTSTFCLRRKDIKKLNSMMTNPEEINKYVNQKDTVLLHFFFLVSKRLGLTKYTKRMKLMITSLYKYYSDLSKKQKFWILFRGLWDKINWYRLNEYSQSGRPEWYFADRHSYSTFLSTLKVDRWIYYQNLNNLYQQFITSQHNLSASNEFFHPLVSYGVFPNKILPLLAYFKFLTLNSKERGGYANIQDNLQNLKLKLTSFGKQMLSNLKK